MTKLREDLEEAQQAVARYDQSGVTPAWAAASMRDFIRDHAAEILAMVEDAERYKFLRDRVGITMLDDIEGRIYHDGADRAIDRARKGEK